MAEQLDAGVVRESPFGLVLSVSPPSVQPFLQARDELREPGSADVVGDRPSVAASASGDASW